MFTCSFIRSLLRNINFAWILVVEPNAEVAAHGLNTLFYKSARKIGMSTKGSVQSLVPYIGGDWQHCDAIIHWHQWQPSAFAASWMEVRERKLLLSARAPA